ncbi:ROK family transcriptional regulator [Yinghuangia seranimata]|uniref:ROK family transcriptional regulator n=1 Tax=Yinghuangia seranimata TaxID=408067 RepID=UPI00248A98E6|nr:ROK family transcriptional regulator [Yinghuangia seranimata]MDI2131266.1 ROK family transcriptional regulator [Yinghuangia seranimata]
MPENARATHLDAVRERNLASVLGAVAHHQPVTRARLAELTGLTKTTVTGQVAVLERLRLVVGADPVRVGGRGRPGAPVSLAPGPVAGLGLEVNGQYLAACVLDMTGAVRARATVAGDNRGRRPDATVAALADLAGRIAAEAAASGLDIVGTAVALPGVLVEDRVNAPNLGWDAVPAADLLTAALPVQPFGVTVDNEANFGALGELWYGAGQGAGSYLYLSGETGVGAGIVVGGKLFRGAHGAAGELGHVVVDPDGRPCRCGGAGCLEQVAGLDALLRTAGIPDASGTAAAGLAELERRLAEGDPAALQAAAAAGAGLAIALTGAVNLLDPDTVVLGGIHARLAPWLVPTVEAAVARSGSRLRGRTPAVRAASLGTESAVRGAAGTAIARIFADPGALA